jgi:uncharacterized protein (TIGR00661 family)
MVLKHYAPATNYIGLHFEQYDDFIYGPVIKNAIEQAQPEDHGHITVYLPHYHDQLLKQILLQLPQYRFEIFSRNMQVVVEDSNLLFRPIANQAFTKSLINCHGIITGAGFETPAEALFLGKKLMVIPIKGQYEQHCNAAALAALQVPVCSTIDNNFPAYCEEWLMQKSITMPVKPVCKEHIIDEVIRKASLTA